ncbi:hypothetical protein TrispH2_006436 [Trichoplax sp. H2]|nr:hypothetical protein TrispH2_006436 [Trichoplax sp. H2]|eukprot:RDD42159.1 hypothetical protein TrispH2_006436 [Trichoplax sp. H2]
MLIISIGKFFLAIIYIFFKSIINTISWILGDFGKFLATLRQPGYGSNFIFHVLISVCIVVLPIVTWESLNTDEQNRPNFMNQESQVATEILRHYCIHKNLLPTIVRNIKSNYNSNHPKSLPYLDSHHYLNRLMYYTSCSIPASTVLLAWGPKSSGKSLGIDLIGDYWAKHSRLVVKVELTQLHRHDDHHQQQYPLAIMRYTILGHGQYQALTLQEMKEIDQAYRHYRRILKNFHHQDWYNFSWLSYLISDITFTLNRRLYNIKSYLKARLGDGLLQPLTTQSVHTLTLLRILLNSITTVRPEISPVLIVDLQALDYQIDQRWRQDFHSLMNKNYLGQNNFVPVIVEVSFHFWASERHHLHSIESVASLLLDEMEVENARQDVVYNYKLWNEGEFERIWDTIGGHAGSWIALFSKYQQLKTNHDINTALQLAIDEISWDACMQLMSAMTHAEQDHQLKLVGQGQKLHQAIRTYLDCLVRQPRQNQNCQDGHGNAIAQYLLSHHILYIDSQFQIKVQNKILQRAITGRCFNINSLTSQDVFRN